VRVAIAIDDHHRDEPFAVQSPVNCDPIELEIVFIVTLICADPALLSPRIPVKIDLLRFEKPLRQCLSGTAPELDLQSRNQRRHYAIRRRTDALNHAHDLLLFISSTIEDEASTTVGGAPVKAAEAKPEHREAAAEEPILLR
jgi:hypothetical protein